MRGVDGALGEIVGGLKGGNAVGGVTRVHVHLPLRRRGLFLVLVGERGERRNGTGDVFRGVRISTRRRLSVPERRLVRVQQVGQRRHAR